MSKSLVLSPLAGIHVQEVIRTDAGWIIASTGPGGGTCPSCGSASNARHGSYRRSLQDLPSQGSPVTIALTVTRLKCLNELCSRRTFAGSIPKVTGPWARRTSRVSEIVRLLGHNAGGRPSERLLACFGMAVSGDAVLRHLKRSSLQPGSGVLRVVGIDDWSWRKGHTDAPMI